MRMPNRKELKALALLRLAEAKHLAAGGFFDGARYLSGYVIELALKARICRVLDVEEYPDTGDLRRVYATHDLDQLLKLAGLSRKLSLANRALFDNWSIAALWRPERRYDTAGTASRKEVEEILNAIGGPNGVLRWIKKHW